MHQQFLTHLTNVYAILIQNQKYQKTVICYIGDPADDPLPIICYELFKKMFSCYLVEDSI